MYILLVEDHTLVREGIVSILQELDDDVQTWQAASGEEAIALLRTQPVDMVLLDLNLPDTDGFAVMREIGALKPEIPIVVLSGIEHPVTRARCLADGARAYISKTLSSAQMLEILRRVLRGERVEDDHELLEKTLLACRITQRQREILRLLHQGMRNKAIASKLNIRETTVKAHIRDIFRLMHVNNRHAAVRKASQLGLL